MKSFWQNHSEEVGMFLWMCAITMAGMMMVFTYDLVAGLFR